MSTKYKLNDTQVKHLAIICYREQGSNDAGVRACASHMCNYYEKWQKSNFKNVYECTFGSGWYWNKEKNMKWVQDHPNVPQSVVDAVRDGIVNGNRTLPEYVDEYDCLSDIASASNNGINFNPLDRTQYKKDITKVKNVYGSAWTFYCFPDGASGYTDAFGYINKTTPTKTEAKPQTQPQQATSSTALTMAKMPELRKGSSGAPVAVMQGILYMMGYKGKNGAEMDLDGAFGANTEYAVRAFQKAAGLTIDGICGKAMWKRLKEGMVT